MNCQSCGASLPPVSDPTLREIACPECGETVDLAVTGEGTQEVTSITPPPPSGDPLIGQTIGAGRYRVDSLLGRGGMGTVYRGTQMSLGREVAIKVLASDLTVDDAFIRRFRREAGTLAAFQHANIVTVHDTGDEEGVHYIVMSFVAGPGGGPTSLRDLLDSGPLDVDLALRIAGQTCAALHYAHERGIIHRDIKPGNILLDSEWNALVADFGIARVTGGLAGTAGEPTLTVAGSSMGTLKYMAPEQKVDATGADARSDVYAMGVVLYEMLTGAVPEGRFEMPTEVRQDADGRLDAIIERALRRLPDQRYPTAGEMAMAVDEVRGARSRGPQTIQPLPATVDASVVAPAHPAPPPTIAPTPPPAVRTPPPIAPVPTPPPAVPTGTLQPAATTPPPATYTAPTPPPATTAPPPPATTTAVFSGPSGGGGKGWLVGVVVLLLIGAGVAAAILMGGDDGDGGNGGGDTPRPPLGGGNGGEKPPFKGKVDEPDPERERRRRLQVRNDLRERLTNGQAIDPATFQRVKAEIGSDPDADVAGASRALYANYRLLLQGRPDLVAAQSPLCEQIAARAQIPVMFLRETVRQNLIPFAQRLTPTMSVEETLGVSTDLVLVRYRFTDRMGKPQVIVAPAIREMGVWRVMVF